LPLATCPVHQGVLDTADRGRNVGKHKRCYLASPLNVASFLFLKEFLEQDQDWKVRVRGAYLVIDSKSRANIRAFVRFLEGRR